MPEESEIPQCKGPDDTALESVARADLAQNGGGLEPKVYDVPQEIDAEVARLKLERMGIEIEALTPEHETYLSSYDMGT